MAHEHPAAETPATARHFTADVEVVAIGEGLADASYPLRLFRHDAHCAATVYFLMCRPDLDLDQALPAMIRRYNEANGGRNTDSAGYHHTITMFHLRAIRAFLAALPAGTGLAEACNRLLDTPIGRKDFMLAYYSKERLFSVAARRGWVEPDCAVPDHHPARAGA